jgi:hypothetical protein
MSVLSNQSRGRLNKDFVCLLLALAVIAGLLGSIFTFLATVEIGEALAFALFLLVSGLLMMGYALGIMVLGWGVIIEFGKHINKQSNQHSAGRPA